MEDPHVHIYLSPEEVDELLEPISDWYHCWGFLAAKIIADEKARRAAKLCGPYGDWPKDGH